MCNKTELIVMAEELAALKKAEEDLNQRIEVIQNEIKEYMLATGEETLQVNNHTIGYRPIESKRIDTKALRALLGDALDPYYLISTTRRFTFVTK